MPVIAPRAEKTMEDMEKVLPPHRRGMQPPKVLPTAIASQVMPRLFMFPVYQKAGKKPL
jgi:hypothetical protein